MVNPRRKFLLVIDIDDTQIPDRNKGRLNPGEKAIIERLRTTLEDLGRQGHVIAHVTNGIFDHYLNVRDQLASPHYISCTASTRIYQRNADSGILELDQDHQALIENCRFDAADSFERMKACTQLIPLGAEHQSASKVSFKFKEGISSQEREKIFHEIYAAFSSNPDLSVQYVEGHEEYYIDLLPLPCVKGENVSYIARKEGIPPENVIAFGNGNNDISMFRREFRGVAVENSVAALVNHVRQLRSDRHIVAQGCRAQGVLNGLHHFGVI